MDRIGQFLKELRHRRIFRAATIYVVVAWGATEILTFILEKLPFPAWTVPVVAIVFIVSFPVAMILAWHFDVTRDGIRSTTPSSAKGELAILLSLGLLIGGTAGLFYLIYPEGVFVTESALVVGPFEPPERSIAVLPFVDLSRDRDQEYLASGLAETLLHQLAQVKDLHVIARTSSFVFKDQNQDIREIGRQLDVGTVLQGGVQKVGDTLRITAQLINTIDNSHIWSEKFDRPDTDIFDIQDEIARAVSLALMDTFAMSEAASSAEQFTNNLAAYDLYLLGRHYWYKRTEESLRRAIDLFEQAINLDPDFALAYTALADAYGVLPDYSNTHIDEIAELAEAATRRAFEIDPNLAEAHASVGLIRLEQGRYAEADREFEKAISLRPGSAMAHMWYGRSLLLQSRYRDSLLVLKKARQLDPLSAVVGSNLGSAYLWNGDFENSKKEFQRAVELSPDSTNGYLGLGFMSRGAGNIDDAVRYYQKAVELAPKNVLILRELAWAYLGLGEDKQADYWLTQAEQQDPGNPYVTFGRKLFFLETGQPSAFVKYTEANLERMPDNPFLIADAAMAQAHARNYDAAVRLYEQVRSLEQKFSQPLFDRWGFMYGYCHALNLIKAYQMTAENDKAETLFREVEDFLDLQAQLETAFPNHNYFSSSLNALRGLEDDALDKLQQAYDKGWRAYRVARNDPALENLHKDHRFVEILSQVEFDVLQMRELVREMEDRGEPEPIPEIN